MKSASANASGALEREVATDPINAPANQLEQPDDTPPNHPGAKSDSLALQADPSLFSQLKEDVAYLRDAERKREREVNGSTWVTTLAVAGLLLTVGVPYLLPIAGKEQGYLGPQFQVYEASVRPDIDRAETRLRDARAGLRVGGTQDFKSTQREVMEHLISAYGAAQELSMAQLQIALFVTQMAKDLDHQSMAGLRSFDATDDPLTLIHANAEKVSACIGESRSRAQVLTEALATNPGTKAGVAGLMRALEDMKDLRRGKDQASSCIATAVELRRQVAAEVSRHDAQVSAFNTAAQHQAIWLKISGALGAILLFANGRPALRALSMRWRKVSVRPSQLDRSAWAGIQVRQGG